MSSRIEPFECRWWVSPTLLAACLALWGLALLAIFLAALPVWLKLALVAGCLAYGGWGLQRQVLLRGPQAFRGLRHDESGWQLWSAGSGWQAVQLRPDSLALPWLIVLRVRLPGGWRTLGCCIPADALGADSHRRLRVRLRFSRRRWAAPG
ncbi:protein YgfX [Pseudomonas paraeruginosa]|uniref:protein YgfX n=1 Tax=Pseudomonas paraeruginosa TaxID=2994495 RepID=UPI0039FC5D1E|nr:hypothetical protein [Pseudomonas aeruginosa]HCF2413825.1 hypothetical protein [Pseudomonas aeruginosa]